MDAIVVDQYLREQRVGTATFLPLDTLKIPSPGSTERLCAMAEQDGRFSLCCDVVSCDESIQKAVLYAVGNTIVCDVSEGRYRDTSTKKWYKIDFQLLFMNLFYLFIVFVTN